MKIKLGVLYGGVSVEHEISIISAVQAMQNINEDKYEIIPIYITKDREWYTGKMLTDIEVYKDFNNLKRYATKVTMYNKDGAYYLQSMGLFKRMVTEVDVVFPIARHPRAHRAPQMWELRLNRGRTRAKDRRKSAK